MKNILKKYSKQMLFACAAMTVIASCAFIFNTVQTTKAASAYYVEYRCYVQNVGWKGWTINHDCGTTEDSLRIEAIQVKLAGGGIPAGMSIRYRAHVQNIGWQSWVSNGATAGTTGQSLRLEAFEVQFVNAPLGTGVEYYAYVQNNGWGGTGVDGSIAGTTGQGLRVESIFIDYVTSVQ